MRLLVGGIGNIFLADDGFGCAVIERLAAKPAPAGVTVRDFGIRGYDLALALGEVDAAVLVDAASRGAAPGTLSVLDLDSVEVSAAGVEPHALTPAAVLGLLDSLGLARPKLRLVACEPRDLGDDLDPSGLSEPVAAVLDDAVRLVEDTVATLLAEGGQSPHA
jgi:hydrogenase maturation protease